MFLSRFSGHQNARSTRRPVSGRRPLVENLEGRQLLSALFTKIETGPPPQVQSFRVGNHIGFEMIQGQHIGSKMIQGNHIGSKMIQGNHIGMNIVGQHIGTNVVDDVAPSGIVARKH